LDAAATGGSCWMDLLRVGEPVKLLPDSVSRVGSWRVSRGGTESEIYC